MKTQNGVSSEIYRILNSNPLFTRLEPKTLDTLAKAARFKKIEENRPIFFHYDVPEAVYIVHTGTVEITLDSADGRQLVINEMHPGDCFGELAVVTGQTHSASAVAGKDTELLVIPRTAFLDALETEPHLTRRLLETTAKRLSSSSEVESGLAFLDAQARVARLLLDLDRQANGGQIVISQEELANRTGLIRQTVAKTLGQWRRSGWIQTGRGRIQILNSQALASWLNERGK